MKLLLIFTAVASIASGQLSATCLADEFAADGFTLGQNIELDYQSTAMSVDGNGDSQISVGFLVPKRYTEQYDASAYSITFNRDLTQGAVGLDGTIGQAAGTNQDACFTNRFANDTQCSNGLNAGVWVNNGPLSGQSQCVDQTVMTIGWTDAMNGAFGETSVVDDGAATRVYVTATVETWSKFTQTTSGTTYAGQMTGNQQLNTGGSATGNVGTHGTSGTHYGDGGDLDVEFGPLVLDDWRYTLYQIPFYLVFPKTVSVQTSFTAGAPVAVLNGVVSQDVVTVNFNPRQTGSGNFAVLDVVVQTNIQHPYGIRGPADMVSPMLAYIGSDNTGSGTHAASITFESWDDASSCTTGICQQNFKLRIVPDASAPCSVAGDYYLEFWATCVNGNSKSGPGGCSLDAELSDAALATKRTSNGFFDLTFTVAHQSFCPEVVDTVSVAVDLNAYHDESFSTAISNNYNGSPTAYTANADVVYTNDIIFYEATYRTASDKSGTTVSNNAGTPGTDSIIDYVRAIKVFVDVTLGESSQGAAVSNWNSADWKTNLSWQLGGSRVPGPGEDFDDSATTVTGARVVQVPSSQPSDSASYRMIMCEVSYIDPAVPIMTGAKPADCFTAETDIANDFFDFDQVLSSLAGSANTIDENEIAFKMRLDERVIPIGPDTDNSFITVTVESEVYYKGNLHPSRRLLQASPSAATLPAQKQMQSKSISHGVKYKKPSIQQCSLDTSLAVTTLDLELDLGATTLDAANVNSWAMNTQLTIENQLQVQNAVRVLMVKACDSQNCNVLLDTKPSSRRLGAVRRLQAAKNIAFVKLEIKSTAHASAGQIANSLQSDVVNGAVLTEAVSMTAPDCHSTGVHNTKLASSASALSTLAAFVLALYASL